MSARPSKLWHLEEDDLSSEKTTNVEPVRWHKQDFVKFTQSPLTGWSLESRRSDDADSEKFKLIDDYADSSAVEDRDQGIMQKFKNVGGALRAFALFATRQSGIGQASQAPNEISMTANAQSRIQVQASRAPQRRSTPADVNAVWRGAEHDLFHSDVASDAEALHIAAEFMTHKFGHVPGIYDKWRKWLTPVCDAERRMRDINKRFEVEYRVNVNDFERSLRPSAKSLRRNIRQLLHKEFAPINNRSWHEKLGKLLIRKGRVDMTSHLRQLEEKERRRQAELLQMGVIKKNPAALQPADATIIKGVKGLGGQRKAKRKGPMALRIIDYLDNPRMDVTGPDLSQLLSTVKSRVTESDMVRSRSRGAYDAPRTPSPETVRAWKASIYRRAPRKTLIVPLGDECLRNLDLLEAPSKESTEEEGADSQSRDEQTTSAASVEPPQSSPVTMKELYSRAGEILKTICIEKEKSQEDEEQVDEEKRPQRFPHRLLREKPAAPP
ncbi:unnamed protein product [Mesocestoides corti]|uniref:Uncharacterized protein n=2 Tax=Mesocestoides corti TaxID=53468 RepID=A0A158QT32_MESCO|nr:unnamed protein product [Mesocestoides corti]